MRFEGEIMNKQMKNGIVYYTFSHIEATGLVDHCFTTRIGGVSTGHFSCLNMGLHREDKPENVRQNYEKVCAALNFDIDKIVVTDQYHTTNIHIATSDDCGFDFFAERKLTHIDGLITNTPSLVLNTYYADCVPLLFLDPKNRAIANCHAGWRGSAQDMAGKTVRRLQQEFGTNPAELLVGIGPSISMANFEIGKDVVDEFTMLHTFADKYLSPSYSKADKWQLDLWGINFQLLLNAGVSPENIEIAELCTYADSELFYSHRRDGLKRGAMVSLIALRGK